MITATNATGEVKAVFLPLERFNWILTDDEGIPKVMGVYKPGLSYSVRKGNKELEAMCKTWLAEGKIKYQEI